MLTLCRSLFFHLENSKFDKYSVGKLHRLQQLITFFSQVLNAINHNVGLHFTEKTFLLKLL